MVQQSARDDQVVLTRFDGIVKDVETADFQARHLQIRDVSDIDVACDHVASGGHAGGQSLRDRPIATAKFKTAPPRAHAKLLEASPLERVE
jgi:hypothetical protein